MIEFKRIRCKKPRTCYPEVIDLFKIGTTKTGTYHTVKHIKFFKTLPNRNNYALNKLNKLKDKH